MKRDIFARLCFFAVALVVGITAVSNGVFWDPEGFPRKQILLLVAVAIGFLVLGLTHGTAWKRPANWMFLGLAGQAVSLQLIDAGSAIGYQHYFLFNLDFARENLLLMLFLIVQAAFVLNEVRKRYPALKRLLFVRLTGLQITLIISVFTLSSAALSRHTVFYLYEIAVATFIQLLNLATVIVAVAIIPDDRLSAVGSKMDAILGRCDKAPKEINNRPWRFPALATLWVVVMSIILNVFVYERHPHIPDETVYLFHAKYLAAGHLTLPLPPVSEGFNLDLMHYEKDRYYSPVPPGWPFVLSLGFVMGMPWLINALLGGMATYLTYLLVDDLYDRFCARVTTLLLCMSPWYLFMAMNFMTHMSTLAFAMIGALGCAKARRHESCIWAAIAGLATGFVSLIRPLEGLALAMTLGFFLLGRLNGKFRLSIPMCFASGVFFTGSLILPYNHMLTGASLKFPIMAYVDKYYEPGANSLGFGANRGLGWTGLDPFPGHGPLDVVVNAALNFHSVNVELFGWSCGSLFLIAVFLFSGVKDRRDLGMLVPTMVIVGIHSLYWFSGGPDFGARYWFLIIVPCTILTARSVKFAAEFFADEKREFAQLRRRIVLMPLILSVFALINFVPWRSIDKYHHYRGMRPDIRVIGKVNSFGRCIVFIRGERHPDYASAAVYNPVSFDGDAPIYVWDRGPELRKHIVEEFPDREIWVIDGPSISGRGYRVVNGPIPYTEYLEELTRLE